MAVKNTAVRSEAVALSLDDVANVLAALRYWQARTTAWERLASEHMGDGAFRAYDDEQVDALCERINCGGGKAVR